MTRNKEYIAVGDWVKGKSKNGELVFGFVESTDLLEGWIKVNVVTCDNEETVGRTVEILSKWVEKLLESPMNEEQILQLVDLALMTRDEPWFIDLSAKLTQLRQGRKVNNKKFKWDPTLKNRLRRLGIGD